MSNIIVSPLRSDTTPAFEVVNLNIRVQDSDFVGQFDQIEVWRSRDTEQGPYRELTADMWKPARLPKTGGNPPLVLTAGALVQIVGKTLEFLLKEKDLVSVLFTGTDPLTLAQVAFQIADQSAGRLRAYVDEQAQLVVETLEPGTGASLCVLPSDAAAILILPLASPDNLAFGKDARIPLMQGVGSYTFRDGMGSTTYYYKIRLRNHSTGATGGDSMAFGSGQSIGVSPANVVCGMLDLVDLSGKPLIGCEVSLNSPFNGTLVEGKALLGWALNGKTDSAGHIQFNLVRGAHYELSIAGANLVKTVIAPMDPAIPSFALLDADFSEQQDYFRVRVPQIPTLLRST